MTDIDWKALVAAASRARHAAYAPYSGYQVGSAVLGASGRVFVARIARPGPLNLAQIALSLRPL